MTRFDNEGTSNNIMVLRSVDILFTSFVPAKFE